MLTEDEGIEAMADLPEPRGPRTALADEAGRPLSLQEIMSDPAARAELAAELDAPVDEDDTVPWEEVRADLLRAIEDAEAARQRRRA